jgi:hypothetical protein
MAATNKCLAQSNNFCTGGKGDLELPMNDGSTSGERRRFAFAAPENFTRSERGLPLVVF